MVKRARNILGCAFMAIILIAVVAIILNRQWLYDFWRGKTYVASPEMAKIRTSLNLTGQGEFIFDASQPELNTSDDFNAHCRREDDEKAILGCYTENNIYIYNIAEAELDGIRELTTAHELLHAVFYRMGDGEKEQLRPYLDQVYNNNTQILSEDLNNYDESERFEELYVRAGTEVKDLPSELESHYERIFTSQDQIVDFYNKYIVVFKKLEVELVALEEEMAQLTETIEQKTTEYERRADQLNASIISFNSCADVAGCFKTEDEFNARRGTLIAEQNALEGLYNELNTLIDTYNSKVEVYNADVLRGEKLNTIINSSSRSNQPLL